MSYSAARYRLREQHTWLAGYGRSNHNTLRPYHRQKRLLDLALAAASLPVAVPLIALCAILIKVEDPAGTVFFHQTRTGAGGRRFRMFKFRTMVANAEQLKQELQHLNELAWPDFKITNDPRITRMGRFLRRTSLDELPQLFNILRGEMSFVGPRPTSFQPHKYDLWQTERLDVLPGLTGLWQILGRGSMEFDERACLDIFYIEHRSIRLDLEILFRTVKAVAVGRGAH